MIDPFTNPDELFDVCDAEGRPTGRTKRRADVHRDGDWHRAFHCWVTLEGGDVPVLLLQRRGAQKDTWPLKLDVTVGGHFAAGETLADVVREAEEEIGLAVTLDELIPLGRRVGSGSQPGIVDRELQDVFLWRGTGRLEDFHPQPVEVDALLEVPLPDLLRLLAGQADWAQARIVRPGHPPEAQVITKADFIPSPDRYFQRVASLIERLLRGEPQQTL